MTATKYSVEVEEAAKSSKPAHYYCANWLH
jgi:hypothetical protein